VRITGLVLAILGTICGAVFVATVNGWFIDLGAPGQILLIVTTGPLAILLLPGGLLIWIIGGVRDAKRRPPAG